jgi:glucosyl-dolichyl phosphate glucuronosyltransferase
MPNSLRLGPRDKVISNSVLQIKNAASFDVTVVLCTYNRCRHLTGALESIAKSKMADSVTWEILIVDNNSTDQTRDVVQGFCHRYPQRVRYVFEPKQGLSYARNAGIEHSRGKVLAFTDDDVTVESGWLQNLTAALNTREWAGVGGRTLPAQEFTPPAWLPTWGASVIFAHFDLGDRPIELKEAPYGANMAFRRSMFSKYGGFRIDLGRDGKDNIGSEDTEFGRRLMAAGERLGYEPTAIVHHLVVPERITQEFVLSWWFDWGRATVRERGDGPDVYGIPRDYVALFRRSVVALGQTLRGAVAVSPSERFEFKCQVSKTRGQIAELRRRTAKRKWREPSAAAIAQR